MQRKDGLALLQTHKNNKLVASSPCLDFTSLNQSRRF